METKTVEDYKKLLTGVIQNQIIILGPTITLAKVRNVKGITVSDDGTVTSLEGKAQERIADLVVQFTQLSDSIVKKTMEPLLSAFPTLQMNAEPPTAQTKEKAKP